MESLIDQIHQNLLAFVAGAWRHQHTWNAGSYAACFLSVQPSGEHVINDWYEWRKLTGPIVLQENWLSPPLFLVAILFLFVQVNLLWE